MYFGGVPGAGFHALSCIRLWRNASRLQEPCYTTKVHIEFPTKVEQEMIQALLVGLEVRFVFFL